MLSHPDSPVESLQQICQQASERASQGDRQAAVRLYERALSIDSSDIVSLNNYGLVLKQIGNNTKAHEIFNRLETIAPTLPEGHYNHGSVFMADGDIPLAIGRFELAVSLRPGYVEAWYSLGICYRRNGLLDEAVKALRQGVECGGGVEYIFQLGVTLHVAGRLKEAESTYGVALGIEARPLFLYNMGVLLQEQKRFAEAIDYFKKVVVLQPDNAKAYNNLGLTMDETGCHREAEACFLKAVALQPDLAEAYNNLGHILMVQCESFKDAQSNFERAVELDSDFSKAWYNLATCLQEQNLITEALRAFRKAIEYAPDFVEAHWNYSHALLVSGNYQEGFNEYRWRWQRPSALKIEVPLPYWQGERVPEATILIHTEQGAGDNIQFIRYLSMVAERVGKIILICEKNLVALFQTSGLADAIVDKGELRDVAKVAQYYCPLLDLPYILQSDLKSIPRPGQYLLAPADLDTELQRIITPSDSLKVGVAWQGNPKHLKDGKRSIPYPVFKRLFNVPGVIFYSLSKDTPPDECDGLRDLAPHLESFAHTAAAISNLDLVISVDTSVAHLAGALCVNTWVLLPFVPDWRWLLKRNDTPWYKSMRLFRQQKRDDWLEVLERVTEKLISMAESKKEVCPHILTDNR